MWYTSRRQILSLMLVLPLAACGFTPVYGPGGAGAVLNNQVAFAAPDDALGFALVSRLEERLGRGGQTYDLVYEISTDTRGLALTDTGDENLVSVEATIAYSLTDRATAQSLASDEVSSFTSYATSASPVATTTARQAAEERLMILLADQIVLRLISSVGAQ